MRNDALYKALRYQDELLDREIASFDNPCRFSGRYKRRKKLIIKAATAEGAFEQGYEKAVKTLRIKHALLAALVIILCGALIFIFSGIPHAGETSRQIKPAAPAAGYDQIVEGTINYTEILLWYEPDKKEVSPLNIFEKYNSGEGRAVTLRKWDSGGYAARYDSADGFEKISVNGHKGFIAEDNDLLVIFWENGDQLLEITGNFAKDEAIDIACAAEAWECRQAD